MAQKTVLHSISVLASVPDLGGGNLAKVSAAEKKEEVVRIKALFADPGSIHAALLTGCKNVAAARKVGEYEV